MPGLGPRTTTDDLLGDLDLSPLVALVTGASAGLGVETVRALAARGARVVATARDTAKAARALAAAGVDLGGSVVLEDVDLASVASVRAATDRISDRIDRPDLLVAGLRGQPGARRRPRPGRAHRVRSYAVDPTSAAALWALSEHLVRESFPDPPCPPGVDP